jgi:hypothetical protein
VSAHFVYAVTPPLQSLRLLSTLRVPPACRTELCTPAWQAVPMTMQARQQGRRRSAVAAFLRLLLALLPTTPPSCPPSQPCALQWDGRNTTLAAFLVGRGPVAYVGWGWNGQALPDWEPLFDLDVGVPLGLCVNASSSVFSRAWSKGTASIDCDSFTATLDFSF